jgi:aspartate/glutamate racemase
MVVLKGGYPFYGKHIGIIMLDCAFPRPVGDIGNARTFPFPVHYEILEGVSAVNLTRHGEKSAVDSLLAAAKRLERMGVRGIATSCGLLIRYQKQLSQAVSVPVATSSLLLLPFLGALLPGDRKIGILTADAGVIDSHILRNAGWEQPDRVVIQGLEGCEVFRKAIMEPESPFELDTDQLCEEIIAVGRQLISESREIGALLLECTNLAPYSGQLRKALSIPVYDATHLVYLLHASTNEEIS